jgi:hypothetical protein
MADSHPAELLSRENVEFEHHATLFRRAPTVPLLMMVVLGCIAGSWTRRTQVLGKPWLARLTWGPKLSTVPLSRQFSRSYGLVCPPVQSRPSHVAVSFLAFVSFRRAPARCSR